MLARLRLRRACEAFEKLERDQEFRVISVQEDKKSRHGPHRDSVWEAFFQAACFYRIDVENRGGIKLSALCVAFFVRGTSLLKFIEEWEVASKTGKLKVEQCRAAESDAAIH